MKTRIVSVLFSAACLLMAFASPAWGQTINVNNTGDSGAGSLRDAIDQLNANAAGDTSFDIVFDPTLANQPIAMGATLNPYAPLNVGSGKTVNVNPTAVPVTVDGGGANRVFFLANSSQTPSNTAFNFWAINFVNCMAKGGDGGNGAFTGGGGAGLGGAVFADTGLTVSMNNCVFGACSAAGGNSPVSAGLGNGGGGGMGGNAGAGKGGSGGGGGLTGIGGDGATGGSSGGGGGIRAGFSTANGGNAPGSSGVSGGMPPDSAGNGGVNGTAGGQDGGGGGAGINVSGRKAGGGGGTDGMDATTGLGGDGGYGGGGGGGDVNGAGNGGFGGGGGGMAGASFGNGGYGGGGGAGSGGGTNSGGGGFGGGAGSNASNPPGFGGGVGNATQGGGGLAAGGAIFVRQGTVLSLTDPIFSNSFTVTGGTGFSNGSSVGTGILLGGDLNLTVSANTELELTQDDFLGGNYQSPETQGKLIMSGPGVLMLSASNSYYGGTIVNGGALVVNDPIFPGKSATGSGPVSVNNSAVLTGGNDTGSQGSIGGNVSMNAGSALVPGMFGNPGILSLLGSTTFAPGTQMFVNLSGTTPGSGYSMLKTRGQMDLSGCDLILVGGYMPATNDSFTIIACGGEGATLHSFNNLPEGAIIPNLFGTPYSAQISYLGGSGHDVTLTILAPSNNANLANLAISTGSLSPAFDPATLVYAVNVPTGTLSAMLTPTVADPNATVTVNDFPIASGTSSPPINLFPGQNALTVVVTAADGVTTVTYTVNVNVALSQDANLLDLEVSNGALSPAFDPATLLYTDNVPSGTTSVSVAPLADDPDAAVLVNGVPVAPGQPSNLIPVSTGPNSIAILVTAPDGVTTKTYTVNVIVAMSLPPVITDLSCDNNPSLINSTVNFSFTATDADTATLGYSLTFGDGSPAVTGQFAQGSTVVTSHVFTSYYAVGTTVSLNVTDGGSTVTQTLLQVVPAPASGAADVGNAALTQAPIVSPLDGLGVSVKAADAGILQLGIDIQSLTRAAYSVSTDWGDAAGRATTVMGTSPVHQFNNRGLFVATTTATNKDTQVQAGKARITLALSSKETGDYPANVKHELGEVRSAPSNDTSITTSKIQGKFDFTGAKPDLVTYEGTIKLPAGMNMSQPFEFWIALGNIVVETTVVIGKGTNPSVANVLKSLKISTKLKKGAITVGGEPATILVTYSAKNTVSNGFDTEGISNKSTDVTPGGKTPAPRKIQVAMLMDGAPFQTVAPVNFTIAKGSDFGGMAGRTGN